MKITCADNRRQQQLLTLVPQSCSRKTITDFFGVSDYLVRVSRELFKRSGILGDVDCKTGRLI